MRSNTRRLVVVTMCVGTMVQGCLGGATSLPGSAPLDGDVVDGAGGGAGHLDGEDDGGHDDAACVPTERCAAFCAEAAELGCPQDGDCCEMCESQFERSVGCERELAALLACAPPHLAPPSYRSDYFTYPTCGLTPFHTRLRFDPDAEPPPSRTCDAEVEAFDRCIFDRTPVLEQYDDRCHVTSPFFVRSVGSTRTSEHDAPEAIETAYLKCPDRTAPYEEHRLKAWCNVEGWCGCYVDHEEIASCHILLHGRGMVHAPASCCAPFFDDYLGL